MNEIASISTIICDGPCGKTIRIGTTGITEYKTCMSCVQAIHPKADPAAIKKPLSISDHVEAIVDEDARKRRTKKGLDNLTIEVEPGIAVQSGVVLYTLNFTIAKVKKFDLGFTKEQLLAMAADVEDNEIKEGLLKK